MAPARLGVCNACSPPPPCWSTLPSSRLSLPCPLTASHLHSLQRASWLQPKYSEQAAGRRMLARQAAAAAGTTLFPDPHACDLGAKRNLSQSYIVGRLLGTGAYGAVSLAIDQRTGQEVAIKVMPKQRGKLTRRKTLDKIHQEISLLAAVQECSNVVALHDVYEDASSVSVVQELCRGGDLEHLLEANGAFTEHQTACIIFEVLKVLATCHANGIVHCDVKPANFMFLQRFNNPLRAIDQGVAHGAWLKAIDFGCSQAVEDLGPGLCRRTGTPVYMAPEVFRRDYACPSDLWSLGMMAYQLLSGRFPFWKTVAECRTRSLDAVMKSVILDEIDLESGAWRKVSPLARELVAGLLQRDPARRLTAAQAMAHEWFDAQLGSSTGPAVAAADMRSNIVPLGPQCRTYSPAGRSQDRAAGGGFGKKRGARPGVLTPA